MITGKVIRCIMHHASKQYPFEVLERGILDTQQGSSILPLRPHLLPVYVSASFFAACEFSLLFIFTFNIQVCCKPWCFWCAVWEAFLVCYLCAIILEAAPWVAV